MNQQASVATEVKSQAYLDRDGRPYVIRELAPADRADLQRFYEDFEPKRAAQGLPPDGSDRIARWLDLVLASGIHLAAVHEGEIVGHSFVVPTSRPGIGEYAVFLRRDLRGRGMGTTMNRCIVDAAKEAGLRGLWLTVQPRNRAAIRSYEKVGFRFVPATALSMEAEMELELNS